MKKASFGRRKYMGQSKKCRGCGECVIPSSPDVVRISKCYWCKSCANEAGKKVYGDIDILWRIVRDPKINVSDIRWVIIKNEISILKKIWGSSIPEDLIQNILEEVPKVPPPVELNIKARL